MSNMADYQTLRGAGLGSFFRARDAASLGIHPRRLGSLVSEGFLEKYGRGLYRFRGSESGATTMESYVMFAVAVPNSILCLSTALSIHEIGTQSPNMVWYAIDRKARVPRNLPIQSRVVRFSEFMMTYGVETRVAQGVPYRITSPARTVVDCFRYQRVCGFDVAMEALYEAIRDRVIPMEEIYRAAEVCRVRTAITPYIDAFGWIDSLR